MNKKVVKFDDPLAERSLTDIKIDYVYLNGEWTISATQEDGIYRTEIKDPDTGKSIVITMPRFADSINLAKAIEANKEPAQEMGRNAIDVKSIILKNKTAVIGAGSGIAAFFIGWLIGKVKK